ncbi:MMPL family transporter [Kitasatospora sp. NBC_01287]|uniref:MMPL family transporter n=1 Tax=Kitasatospora sp. NBC_01287 TaxID=2903573 RepID=UPI002257C27C|nr:MMPL family transporter [Kitasatospora sp. NBC_01287]MCX4748917.1 MMPL family transporter [Kitasatospora sp. NBC_01287]
MTTRPNTGPTARPSTRPHSRPGLAVAIGDWSTRHRKLAVWGWLLAVVLATMIGTAVGTAKSTDVDNGVGESGRAVKILSDAGLRTPAAETVLIQSSQFTADDQRFRAAVEQAAAAVQGTGAVSDVQSPYDDGAISADRHSALVTFSMTGAPDTAADRVQPVLDAVAKVQAAQPGLRVEEFGEAGAKKAFNDIFTGDFKQAEWTAVPLALGILLVVFGALLAAVLPVALAVTAFTGAFGLVAVSSHLVPTDDNASSVMLLVGLAVGVDYCLFYIRREREERAAGREPGAALRIAAATSGHSVLVSGLTVAVAMAGMFLTGIATFQAMGLATILVVVVAVLGSVTVLPALLSMLGDRVEKGRVPLLSRMRRNNPAGGSRIWAAIIRAVLAKPLLSTVVAAGVLLALAAPVFSMHTAQLSSAQELPSGNAVVATGERIQQAFPGNPLPAQVVLKAKDVTDPAVTKAIADFQREALATGQVHQPVSVAVHPQQGVAVIDLSLAGTGTDTASVNAVKTLRDTVVPHTLGTVAGAEVAVGGSTAASIDFNSQLSGSVVPVFGFVLVLAFVLMLLSFRSLVIAVTAVVLNLLSVGAAYGVLTLVFQDGVAASLLGSHKVGAIEAWLPLFLFVILFGLSMDYHVFVVSRIKEGRDKGLATRDAIAHGIGSTAGVITSAAVIMVGVFAIFGTLSVVSMKEIGVGLGVAVFLDASIIRGVLLPAVMTLLGDRNWYLPSWLAWLPDLSHSRGEAAVTADLAAAAADSRHEPRESVLL